MKNTQLSALKLAYIKLKQCGGFDQVDGVKTPDIQAEKQILAAIHEDDPTFQYEPEEQCPHDHVTDDYCTDCGAWLPKESEA